MVKQLLFSFVFLLLVGISYGQSNVRPYKPLPDERNSNWKRNGWLQVDSGFIQAVRDTNFTPRFAGTEIVWQNAGIDTAKWLWTGSRWVKPIGTTTGGSGNPNSNIGSFFRLAIPNTNNIKTIAPGYGQKMDSTTNLNAITTSPDSTIFSTKVYAQSVVNGYINDTSALHNQIVSNTAAIGNRFDSLRNNAGVLEGRKNGVFVPQFTLPTGGGGGVTNAGNGYRLVLSGNYIKTLHGKYALILDTTTTGEIGFTVDTGNGGVIARPSTVSEDDALVYSAGSWQGRSIDEQFVYEHGNQRSGGGATETNDPYRILFEDSANSARNTYVGLDLLSINNRGFRNNSNILQYQDASGVWQNIGSGSGTTIDTTSLSNRINKKVDVPVTVPYTNTLKFDFNKNSLKHTQSGVETFTFDTTGMKINTTYMFTVVGSGDSLRWQFPIKWKNAILPQFDKVNHFTFFLDVDGTINGDVSVENPNFANIIYLTNNNFKTYAGYQWNLLNIDNSTGSVITVSLGLSNGATEIQTPFKIAANSRITLNPLYRFDSETQVYINGITTGVTLSVNNPGLNQSRL